MTLFQYIMQSVSTKKRCNTALFRWAGRFRFDLLPRRFLPAQIARLARSIKGDESKRANQIAQGGDFLHRTLSRALQAGSDWSWAAWVGMRSAVATRNSGTFTLKCKRGSKSNYDPGFDISRKWEASWCRSPM
jgi:hypothetical protein